MTHPSTTREALIAEALDDAADAQSVDAIHRTAVKQLRMIAVGVQGWHSES